MTPVQSGMFPQSQMDRTQFAVPSQMPISREIVDSDFDTKINPYTGDMPRFDGGGHVGIKSVAKNLAKYGRGGDSIVAHINPQEAAMLKAMGGSGTINPHTGLPEYLGGWVGKQIGNAWEGAKSIVPGVKELDKGLVGLDKTIGKAIPGGWGTVASIAGSAMGLPTAAMVGLGALSGSGIGHPGRKFSLQGAILGGAMAYGMAELGNYARNANLDAASPAVDVATNSAPAIPTPPTTDFIGSFASPNAPVGGDFISGFSGANPAIPPAPPSIGSNIMSGNFGDAVSQIGTKIGDTATSGIESLKNIGSKAIDPATYSQYLDNASRTVGGISDLITDNTAAVEQADKLGAVQNIMSPGKAALATGVGLMGASAADQMADYEKQSAAQNQQANSDFALQMAGIQDAQDRAYKSMRAHPFQYAQGGDVSRFLSGGGDGLSDSIKATINDKQPARLADGEFVVSADVVSGLGGGSSKAGAKKLYAMMDRVRKQAHGTKKQIRPVGIKALPA